MSPLGDSEKAGIAQTIDEDILKGGSIAFRSTSVQVSGRRLQVHGELELLGARAPLDFALLIEDGHLTGSAMVKRPTGA